MKAPYPYYLCTAEQSRLLDQRTISEFGIDGFTLMEIAGTRGADFISSKVKPHSHALIICGKGNNAGDALVVARLLAESNFKISLCFVLGTKDLSPDTRRNLDLLNLLHPDIPKLKIDELIDFSSFDFIVDGIFGTGLSSEVRQPISGLIQKVNESQKLVFALDVPSGLNSDSGEILGEAFKANFTLSFGILKIGCYLDEGFDYSGNVVLCPLPFPNKWKEAEAFLIDQEWFDQIKNPKSQQSHKYDGGVVYIIAGSEGLTGAAILSSQSAWAEGVGAVVLITPKGLLDIYEKNLPQIIKKPVGNNNSTSFEESHTDEVLQILAEKPGTLLIGPGLGRSKSTIQFIEIILSNFIGDVVIDADALYALSQIKNWEKPENSNWIMTPHDGELSKLLEIKISSSSQKSDLLKDFSKRYNVTILSKGLPAIVQHPQKTPFLTAYDTRIYSRAGFGDVLAGSLISNWLLEKNAELSCIKSLLSGSQKAQEHLNSNETPLEPIHLIN